jgi:putative ABC transport system permease protein
MLADFKWIGLAAKNALRNRRRSLVTLVITATGTAAALLGGGFALHTYQSLAQASARDTGHLVLAAPRFFDGDESVPLEHGLDDSVALSTRLLAMPGVNRVLPRLQFSGLISNGDKSEIFIGTGVDARQEFVVKGPFMKREAGELLDSQSAGAAPGVVLGKGLARILGAHPGSSLTLMSTTTGGALNALDVTVTGVVSTGIADYDKRLVLVDLASAQSLLATHKVSSLALYLDEIADTDAIAARLKASFGHSYALRTWLQQAFFYQGVKGLYDRIFGFLGAILLVLVLFAVANTLGMAVLERTREIGTLRAMGTTPGEVTRLFTYEGLSLGGGGALLGMFGAGAIAFTLLFLDVQMPPPPGSSKGYPLVLVVSAPMYLTAGAIVTLLSGVAAWFVSRRAANQSVVEALAHV